MSRLWAATTEGRSALKTARALRQRLVLALRCQLRDISNCQGPPDVLRAIQAERELLRQAMEVLATPLPDVPTAEQRRDEQWLESLERSIANADRLPTTARVRNRSRRLPSEQGLPEAPPPAPEAPAEPELTGWRLSRARRLQAAGRA